MPDEGMRQETGSSRTSRAFRHGTSRMRTARTERKESQKTNCNALTSPKLCSCSQRTKLTLLHWKSQHKPTSSTLPTYKECLILVDTIWKTAHHRNENARKYTTNEEEVGNKDLMHVVCSQALSRMHVIGPSGNAKSPTIG